MSELDGQRILVLGLGVSGRSAADFCAARGADVVAADERSAGELGDIDSLDPRVERALGRSFPDPTGFDLVVPSPGVPPERYRSRARRVWGDVELAGRELGVPIVAVTGTNGKSTVTLLVAAMLHAAGFRARAAGNVGEPALGLVGQPLDVAVLEVSSFQLETIESFRPRVAVILNAVPDHLDRHGSFEAYVAAKARILENQTDADTAVLNFEDPVVRPLADAVRGQLLPFALAGPLERGGWLDAGALIVRAGEAPATRVTLESLEIAGAHNRQNALAALLAAVAAGADPVAAGSALSSFRGLPHRAEVVARVAGVTWVNDSKATNPGAALCALRGFAPPLVWIAGGRDKGLDMGELADASVGRVRAAILIGEAAEKLGIALAGRTEVHRADSIEAAVARAAQIADAGATVLLAPACASQDQFRDFAERGDRFRDAVAALGRAGGAA